MTGSPDQDPEDGGAPGAVLYTGPLYESRVMLSPARPQALSAILDPTLRHNPVQQAHRMLWTLFADSPERARDFLYLVEHNQPLTMIVRSRRSPVDSMGIWQIQHSYPLAPHLRSGQRLRFRLRAVATKWQPQPGQKRGKRQDVMVSAWATLPEAERTPERLEAVAEQTARDWLVAQSQRLGFSIHGNTNYVQVLNYQREKFPTRKGKPIRYGVVTYEGVLMVDDPALFRHTLAEGLGAARGFGNGLLQIAPVSDTD